MRERPHFVEARVSRGRDISILRWAQDSVFRFFPLVTRPDLGLSLHPFDLTTQRRQKPLGCRSGYGLGGGRKTPRRRGLLQRSARNLKRHRERLHAAAILLAR